MLSEMVFSQNKFVTLRKYMSVNTCHYISVILTKDYTMIT